MKKPASFAAGFAVHRARLAPATFVVVAAAIWSAEVALTRTLVRGSIPDLVAAGILLDVLVVVPLLGYVLLVRGCGWPLVTLLPILVASLLGAGALLVAAGSRASGLVPFAAGVVEIGAISWALVLGRRVVRSARAAGSDLDFADRLEAGFDDVFGSGLAARVLSTETGLFGYALGFGRRRRRTAGANSFTCHRRSAYGAAIGALILVAVTEMAAMHFVLRRFWPALTIPHLALGAYGMLWILGDLGSVVSRRHRTDSDALRLRVGLRFALDAPWDAVSSVEALDAASEPPGSPGAKVAVALGAPGVAVRFFRPIRFRTVYGLGREVSTVRLGVDDPDGFVRACAARLAGGRPDAAPPDQRIEDDMARPAPPVATS